MKKEEVIDWLMIMKANLNSFPPEVSGVRKIEALAEAIRLLKNEQSKEPRTPIRPKGHWIETAEEYYKAINEKGGGVNENTDYFVDDIACSECLAKFSVIDNEAERFDFCPCCGSDNREVKNTKSGAKMEEVRNERNEYGRYAKNYQ